MHFEQWWSNLRPTPFSFLQLVMIDSAAVEAEDLSAFPAVPPPIQKRKLLPALHALGDGGVVQEEQQVVAVGGQVVVLLLTSPPVRRECSSFAC